MIEFVNFKKNFGNKEILKGLTFKVNKGEIVFILGMSGTGKSVLLKNIVGLMRPTSGQLFVAGEDISGFKESQYYEVRKKCGMVLQSPALFESFTVFENIAFGLRRNSSFDEAEIDRRVKESLRLVQLKGVEHKWPQELSFGMQKRVSLARTLAVVPKILLFDEPTTGLDPVTTNVINKLIFDLSRELNTTSVVVSHDISCALDIADRIIVLDGGQIVAQGSPKELVKSTIPLVKDFLMEVR